MADIESNATYTEGLEAGVELFGAFCSEHDCESCPLALLAGDEDCMEYAANHPAKVTSIIMDEDMGHTNFEEFLIRNPNYKLDLEETAEYMCQNVILHSDTSCPKCPNGEKPSTEQCIECWNERFTGNDDIYSDEEEDSEDE